MSIPKKTIRHLIMHLNDNNICEKSCENTLYCSKVIASSLLITAFLFFFIMFIGIPLTYILSYWINIYNLYYFNNVLSLLIWLFILGIVTLFIISLLICLLFCFNFIIKYLILFIRYFFKKNIEIELDDEL